MTRYCRNPEPAAPARTVSKHPVLNCPPNKPLAIPMSGLGFMRQRRPWLAAFALLAFTARTLIPAGFMPSGEGFFKLQICPEGLSTQAFALLDPHAAHHHHHPTAADGTSPMPAHDHRSWSSGHCSFGALASTLQSFHSVSVAFALEIISAPALPQPLRIAAEHRFRIAQPRGPPFLV